MHNACGIYPCDYYFNMPVYNPYYPVTSDTQYLPYTDKINNYSRFDPSYSIKDQGPNPFSINIEEATEQNNNYRTTLWTGKNLQVTLMSIDVNDDIGLEIHPDVDQFLRIEEGTGIVRMGYEKDNLNYEKRVGDDFAIMVPAGTWHNLINTAIGRLNYTPFMHHLIILTVLFMKQKQLQKLMVTKIRNLIAKNFFDLNNLLILTNIKKVLEQLVI